MKDVMRYYQLKQLLGQIIFLGSWKIQTSLWYYRFVYTVYTHEGKMGNLSNWQINLGLHLYFCLQPRKHSWVVLAI